MNKETQYMLAGISTFMTLMTVLAILFICLNACTYSVVMNHTEGEASDMVDENQTTSPNVSPNIVIPTPKLVRYNRPKKPRECYATC